MCGIISIYGQKHYLERAKEGLKAIEHRGTSNSELKDFDFAVLGTNRLPLVGRETGTQPISNEDGSVWSILNGEIFNFLELRKELESRGHKFKTSVDTEVLVHMYEEYGVDMLNRLGSEMFAFVIYDDKNKDIFAARDPIGVKPLYYAYDKDKNLYFFSELKQVANWGEISEIHTFEPGTYFYKGEFKKYFSIKPNTSISNEDEASKKLATLLEKAVKDRVQTDLPVAVLLSGGVDSSTVMELATRYHPNVTAIILGTPESSDYQAATKLCEEKGYKYKIITPDPEYFKELDTLLYYAEMYEPNVIRHCFANHMCSKVIAELGIRIALVGEGSDEIFGGYNEFTKVNPLKINLASQKMTETLENSHLQRVDRMSMWHTIEVRVPFLDTEVVNFAFSLASNLKIRDVNGVTTTKYILRKTAERYLPQNIAWRYKVPFANGAGINVGVSYQTEDGEITEYLKGVVFNQPTEDEVKIYNLKTLEDRYYFSKFKEYNYDKLTEARNRPFMKDTLPVMFQ